MALCRRPSLTATDELSVARTGQETWIAERSTNAIGAKKVYEAALNTARLT